MLVNEPVINDDYAIKSVMSVDNLQSNLLAAILLSEEMHLLNFLICHLFFVSPPLVFLPRFFVS